MQNINDWWWPVNTGDKEDSPKICDDDDDVNDQDDVVDGGVDVVWVKIFATTFKWSGSGRSVWATVSQVCLFPTIDKNTKIIGEINTKIQIKKYNLQMEWSEPQSPKFVFSPPLTKYKYK